MSPSPEERAQGLRETAAKLREQILHCPNPAERRVAENLARMSEAEADAILAQSDAETKKAPTEAGAK